MTEVEKLLTRIAADLSIITAVLTAQPEPAPEPCPSFYGRVACELLTGHEGKHQGSRGDKTYSWPNRQAADLEQ